MYTVENYPMKEKETEIFMRHAEQSSEMGSFQRSKQKLYS
jgi:hypothetical protein